MTSFVVTRFNDLDRATLMRLQRLTNDISRGDFRDNGIASRGSAFRSRLDARLMGEVFPHDCWAILAHNTLLHTVQAWAMVTRHQHGPEGEPLSVPTASAGFYVHPNLRRTGLGTSLLQEASELSRKNGIGRLLVTPWNRASLSFFQANGFELLEEHGDLVRGLAAKDLDPGPKGEQKPSLNVL